jgi:very-short-patch-repair endonuclease
MSISTFLEIRMILIEKTIELYGHNPETLAKSSTKKMLVLCDYCKEEFETFPKKRQTTQKVIQTDCCKKCRYIKVGDLSILKYGVRNVFELQSVKDKIVAKNIEIYGVARPTQNQAIKDKVKNTFIERYGVTNPMAIEGMQDSRKEACLEKYGFENPSSVPEFKEKRKQTCLDKFGKEYYLGSEDCKIKSRETNGVDNVFQLDSVKQKSKETMISRYGVDNMMKLPEVAESNAKKCRKTKIDKGVIVPHDGKTQVEWAEITGFSRSRFSALVKKHGWELAVKMTPRVSSLETMVEQWLIDSQILYQKQVKIGSYFADFVLSNNIVVELNGNFWHSEYHKADDYHIKKREAYIKAGYTPLFFMEDELLNKFHIVKSIILNKLGKSTRLFARKLQISQISKKDGGHFLKENHLMGQGKGECFALLQDGVIMAVLRTCRIKDGWEISRFATKINHTIVGGFSRLLSFFTEDFAPAKLVTFIDLRYGMGEYLASLGFVKGKAHPSFKWTDGTNTFHRMKFPSSTGRDSGLYKIWDCGQLRYTR